MESIHGDDFDMMGMCPRCLSENYYRGICDDCGYVRVKDDKYELDSHRCDLTDDLSSTY